MFGYRVPDADEVMLISGGRKTSEEMPFRIERSAKFIIPGFRKVTMLPLSQQQAIIEEDCTTTQGINISVKAVVAFKIATDDLSIYAAGQRFKDDLKVGRGQGQTAMAQQAGLTFAGHLRSIVGAMTLEEIIQQRQKLADEVLDASKVEMGKMGLVVDSFQLTSVGGQQAQSYIDAMSAPHKAKIQQEAQIAQAEAERAAAIARSQAAQLSAEAEQESQRKQAEFQRETLVTKAKLQAEVDKENETAKQAGPLAAANAQKAVLVAETELATGQASLREAQLRADQLKVAEAEAQRIKIAAQAEADRLKIAAGAQAEATRLQADADAHKMQVQAEAMAANDRVNLDQMLINQLPQLVQAASQTLRGANVTIFDGVEGANKTITAAVTQGLSIFNTVRDQLTKTSDQAAIRQIEDLANQGK